MNPERKIPIYLCVFLIILGFSVYANSLNNSFLDADDIPAIVDNPEISQFSGSWLNPQSLLNSLGYHILGHNPFIYHLISIILHCINIILVFLFLRLFFNLKASFLAACLFAVHPIHTEAITWISGRSHAITAFFILATYLLYYRSTNPPTGRKLNPLVYLASLSVFSYFLISSYSFFALLPLLLILSDVTFKKWRRNWLYWFPFLAIVIIRLILAQNQISHRITYMRDNIGFPTTNNPVVYFVYSFYYHLWLLLWPAKLTLIHEQLIIPQTLLNYSILYLIAIGLCLFFTYKKAKEVFWGLSIFILFLAPTYSLVRITSLIAERYLYFPSIALSIFLAFLYEKGMAKFSRFKRYILAALILIIVACGIRTVVRNQDYKTPKIFWRKIIAMSPDRVEGHNNLAFVYFKDGDIASAIQEYNIAIQINPYYARAYLNRGNVYQSQGNISQAISDYNQSIEIKPNYAEAYNNRGIAYRNQGNFEQAIFDFHKAIESKPNYVVAYHNRGIAYQSRGDLNQAILDYNKAIEIKPSYAEAYINRGFAYYGQGNLNQAILDYNKAIEIKPNNAEVYINRGNVYLSQGNISQAISDYNQSIEIKPNNAEAYHNRGIAYRNQGNFEQAIFDCNKAIEIKPSYAEAYINRGIAYYDQGNLNLAILDYNQAIEIKPNNAGAYAKRWFAYRQKGDLEKGITDCTKAIKINHYAGNACYARAIIYFVKQEYDKAWADVHKAKTLGVAIGPPFIEALKKASGKKK